MASKRPFCMAAQVMELIRSDSDGIFPKRLRLKGRACEAEQDVELFGPLIKLMERKLEADEALCARLVEQAIRRRAISALPRASEL